MILHWGSMGAPLDTSVRMALAALAWLLGIGLQMQQPALWPSSVYAALVAAALVLLPAGWALRGRRT